MPPVRDSPLSPRRSSNNSESLLRWESRRGRHRAFHANGYQGLFEPKTPPGVPKPPEPPPVHIPDELIPPWDKDHAAGGPLCSTKDRWWQYGDDYKAGRMNGPDWWRDTPMGRKWLREQAQEAEVSR